MQREHSKSLGRIRQQEAAAAWPPTSDAASPNALEAYEDSLGAERRTRVQHLTHFFLRAMAGQAEKKQAWFLDWDDYDFRQAKITVQTLVAHQPPSGQER